MSDGGTEPGIALRPGYLERLSKLVDQIPAAKKLLEQARDPRTPVWRRGLAWLALAQTLLEVVMERKPPPEEPPKPG
jgi:hypothetical protein